MKTNKLTIAIPVFERYDFFETAVNSVLNQTVVPKLIVVDNNSSHNQFEDYCNINNIRYYKNQTNIGMFGNWNKCFELCNTEFVMLLGDDDYLDNNYVEVFLDKLNQYPNLDLFYTDFASINYPENKLSFHKHTIPFGYFNKADTILEYGIEYKLGFPLVTATFKKSSFQGFYTAFHASNDWLWIYSNASKLEIFGENSKIQKRGIHYLNDSSNPITSFQCNLSFAYIYETILAKHQYKNSKLNSLALKNASEIIKYFVCYCPNNLIEDIRNKPNIYSDYLNKKLVENIYLRFILKMPKFLKKLLYHLTK
jgi:glycosyltransferase involved in cell wall biosynthesis